MIYLNIYYRQLKSQITNYKYVTLFIYLIFCIYPYHLKSQSINSEIEKYQSTQKEKNNQLLELHNHKKGLFWLNLLPNVVYDIDRNIFNLSLNLSSISVYLQQKQRNKIEQSKLEIQLQENLNNQILQLQKEKEQIQKDSIESSLLEQNFKLSKQLFDILKKQYSNNQINSESWLKFQQEHNATELKFKSSQKSYFIKKDNLKRKLNEKI